MSEEGVSSRIIWKEVMRSDRNSGEGEEGEVSCWYLAAESSFRGGMSYFSART